MYSKTNGMDDAIVPSNHRPVLYDVSPHPSAPVLPLFLSLGPYRLRVSRGIMAIELYKPAPADGSIGPSAIVNGPSAIYIDV